MRTTEIDPFTVSTPKQRRLLVNLLVEKGACRRGARHGTYPLVGKSLHDALVNLRQEYELRGSGYWRYILERFDESMPSIGQIRVALGDYYTTRNVDVPGAVTDHCILRRMQVRLGTVDASGLATIIALAMEKLDKKERRNRKRRAQYLADKREVLKIGTLNQMRRAAAKKGARR